MVCATHRRSHPSLPSLGHDLHEVVGQVASGQVETQDGVGKGVTLIDGDGVGDTISDVEDHTGGTTRGVQGEDSLDAHVAVGKIKKEEKIIRLMSIIKILYEARSDNNAHNKALNSSDNSCCSK